jgi:hypothetical protein
VINWTHNHFLRGHRPWSRGISLFPWVSYKIKMYTFTLSCKLQYKFSSLSSYNSDIEVR